MSATPLSDSIEVVERSLFHSIRRELVDKGYLPDIEGVTNFAINQVNQGAKTFRVTGNASILFTASRVFNVIESTGNNAVYTIVSAVFTTPNTLITVVEAIPNAVADGNVSIYTYYDDTAGILSYNNAISAIVISKGFCIELFGVSSPQAKQLKKVPRIAIITNQALPGALGGAPDRVYTVNNGDPLNPDAFTAKVLPPQTTNFTYDIHLVSNSAKQSREMRGILALAVPKLGYIPYYNDSTKRIFVNQYSFRNIPNSVEGINEDIYMYRVDDIFETENATVGTNIKPILEITVDRNEGDEDNFKHIDNVVID